MQHPKQMLHYFYHNFLCVIPGKSMKSAGPFPKFIRKTIKEFYLFPPKGFVAEDFGTQSGQGSFIPQIYKYSLPPNLSGCLSFTGTRYLAAITEHIFVAPMATLDSLTNAPDFKLIPLLPTL